MMYPKPSKTRRIKDKVQKIKLQDKKECWVCGSTQWLEDNHIFGGANRPLSEQYGLKVWMCHCHHNENIPGDPGYHHNKKLREELQELARKKFAEVYGDDEFLRIFKGVYKVQFNIL